MKKIIGGVRILCIITCTISFIFYTNLNYAQEPQRISMDFQEAALRDVIKVFSQQAGLNFVAAKEIENKRVTLYLDGVTVQDALNSILEANNLTYDQKPDSSVFIVKESGKAKIKMITKVYNLNYARVAGVAGAGACGATDAFAGSPEGGGREAGIKSIIENLLTKEEGPGGIEKKPFGNVAVDKRTNSLIITTIPEDFPLIEATLAKLDTRTSQVMIEAEVIEVVSTAIEKLGLDWGSDSDGNFFTFTGPSRPTGFPFVRDSGPFSRSLLGGACADARGRSLEGATASFGTLSLAEFRVVLKALEKDNKSRYLAKPKIMVVNNETAEIKIITDAAVGTTTTTETSTGTTGETIEREEVGVILKVTPTISKDNYITMTLEPEISRIEVSNVSTSIYDPKKRSAKTTVMMKDGQTIAIGGLLKGEIADSRRATPGLSKIPLLGNLFKSKDFQDIETEIIIFVTCNILKPELEKEKMAAVELPPVELKKEAAVTQRDKEILKAVKRLRKRRELK